jgi:hypothetical protein
LGFEPPRRGRGPGEGARASGRRGRGPDAEVAGRGERGHSGALERERRRGLPEIIWTSPVRAIETQFFATKVH